MTAKDAAKFRDPKLAEKVAVTNALTGEGVEELIKALEL